MSRTITISISALALLLVLTGQASSEPDGNDSGNPASLLGLEARRLGGAPEPLSRYRGQVLLVVNTASRCGYTPQYEELQDLYDLHKGRGFSVLGFPSNDFGRQEPGSDREIGAFCRANYGVEFPMFSKVHVKGAETHPVYAYLTSLPEPIGGAVQWNFQKYLVDREGRVVARYAPGLSPQDPELVAEIQRLLDEPRPGASTAGLLR
jgi:glutathione peroxidase